MTLTEMNELINAHNAFAETEEFEDLDLTNSESYIISFMEGEDEPKFVKVESGKHPLEPVLEAFGILDKYRKIPLPIKVVQETLMVRVGSVKFYYLSSLKLSLIEIKPMEAIKKL